MDSYAVMLQLRIEGQVADGSAVRQCPRQPRYAPLHWFREAACGAVLRGRTQRSRAGSHSPPDRSLGSNRGIMEELERSKFTPAGEIANERLIDAVLDPDRYPEGTTFIAADQEGFGSILAEAVADHRPLAIVYPDGREIVAAPRGGALAFFEHLLTRRREPRRRSASRPATRRLSGRNQGPATRRRLNPALPSPDLPANPRRAKRLSRARSARPPQGVDSRERCATIAAGRGQPMPRSKPWSISWLCSIERSSCWVRSRRRWASRIRIAGRGLGRSGPARSSRLLPEGAVGVLDPVLVPVGLDAPHAPVPRLGLLGVAGPLAQLVDDVGGRGRAGRRGPPARCARPGPGGRPRARAVLLRPAGPQRSRISSRIRSSSSAFCSRSCVTGSSRLRSRQPRPSAASRCAHGVVVARLRELQHRLLLGAALLDVGLLGGGLAQRLAPCDQLLARQLAKLGAQRLVVRGALGAVALRALRRRGRSPRARAASARTRRALPESPAWRRGRSPRGCVRRRRRAPACPSRGRPSRRRGPRSLPGRCRW